MNIKEFISNNIMTLIKVFIALIIVVFVVGYFQDGRKYVAGIIDKLISSRVEQTIGDYKSQMKQMNEQQSASIKKINSLNKKIKDLEGDIHANKKPETSSELRDRFTALGFNPVDM